MNYASAINTRTARGNKLVIVHSEQEAALYLKRPDVYAVVCRDSLGYEKVCHSAYESRMFFQQYKFAFA